MTAPEERGEHMQLISAHKVNSIKSLYTLQMRYLLSTLNQIPKCLEELVDAASDRQLKEAFHSHLMESGLQRERVDQILLELTSKVVDKKCPVTAALIATVEKIVRETDRGLVRDAWLVASARKIEEFETVSYHAAIEWALSLGYTYQASLLEATLAEERRADDLFCSIEERINLAMKAA
jgi:ferritin-like metal-binding protein YciE